MAHLGYFEVYRYPCFPDDFERLNGRMRLFVRPDQAKDLCFEMFGDLGIPDRAALQLRESRFLYWEHKPGFKHLTAFDDRVVTDPKVCRKSPGGHRPGFRGAAKIFPNFHHCLFVNPKQSP